MTNPFTVITRALNKEFKAQLPIGYRIQASGVGSFIALRIDDLHGYVQVKVAQAIIDRAGQLFLADGMVDNPRAMNGLSYHMDGIVANWQRSF